MLLNNLYKLFLHSSLHAQKTVTYPIFSDMINVLPCHGSTFPRPNNIFQKYPNISTVSFLWKISKYFDCFNSMKNIQIFRLFHFYEKYPNISTVSLLWKIFKYFECFIFYEKYPNISSVSLLWKIFKYFECFIFMKNIQIFRVFHFYEKYPNISSVSFLWKIFKYLECFILMRNISSVSFLWREICVAVHWNFWLPLRDGILHGHTEGPIRKIYCHDNCECSRHSNFCGTCSTLKFKAINCNSFFGLCNICPSIRAMNLAGLCNMADALFSLYV